MTEYIRKDAQSDMLFADDIVLSRQKHRELVEDLEIWRNALERRDLKVSWSKTKYLRVGGVDDGEELKLQGEKVKRAKNFKYLGSTVSSDGRCKKEVKRRNQAGWMSRRKVSGVLATGSYQQRLRVKCTRGLLDQPCFMTGVGNLFNAVCQFLNFVSCACRTIFNNIVQGWATFSFQCAKL